VKAKVIDVQKNRKVRGRPVPFNTIEAQKMISKKLKISSSESMEIMEKLY
jgi:DNA topoisomerase IA